MRDVGASGSANVSGARGRVNFAAPHHSKSVFLKERAKEKVNYSAVASPGFHREGQYGERGRASLHLRSLGRAPATIFVIFTAILELSRTIQSEFFVPQNAAPNMVPPLHPQAAATSGSAIKFIQVSDFLLLLCANVSVMIELLNKLLHKIGFDISIFVFAQLLR